MATIIESGVVRLKTILGDPKNGVAPLIPMSREAWRLGVRAGRLPQPVRLAPRAVAWRVSDIEALIRGEWTPAPVQAVEETS